MAGPTAGSGAGDGTEPRVPDATAQAEAQRWREIAVDREASLADLRRRPLVRLAVRLDRRLAPITRRVQARKAGWRNGAGSLSVAAAALPTLPARARRRTHVWREIDRLPTPAEAPLVSVITVPGWGDDAWRAAAGVPLEVIVVGRGGGEGLPAERYVPTPGRQRLAALADGAAAATGGLLCFVPQPMRAPSPGWLARLAGTIGDDAVAATPTLLHADRSGWRRTEHDLLVRSQGFDVESGPSGFPVAVARAAGQPLDVSGPVMPVEGAPLLGLVVDRSAYLEAGGLVSPPLDEAAADDVAALDLCARLQRHGGRILHVPSAVAFDDRPVAQRSALRCPVDPHGAAWRWFVERHGASLPAGRVRDATRWVITTAAPSARVADRWGDWHLAESLARALRRLGQDVQVVTLDQADSLAARSRDVHLVLHGLAAVRRTPGQRHVLWVISHPETLDLAECDAADLVVVASTRFADHLRLRTSTPVEVLLQATDAERFRPLPPDPAQRHPVTVVAKSRDVRRRIVDDAIVAGLRPAIYGSGWDGLIDPSLVVTDHVDNEVLPVVYSSAGVVLNDHWDTMRTWGFVSNRLFDVLACGTPVISDDLPEVHDLFGDAVPTYRTSAELAQLVAAALDHPDQARARAAQGRATVLEHHTFDHRARALLALLAQHAPPAAPATRSGPGVR